MKNKAVFLNNIANIYSEFRRFNLALSKFKEVFYIAQEIKDSPGIVFSHLNIATTNFHLGNIPIAIKECEMAIQEANKIGDLYLTALVLTRLSTMHNQLKKFKESFNRLEEVFKIYTLINHPEGMGTTLFNIGANYAHQYLDSMAIRKYNESLKIFEKSNNQFKQAEVHHHLAGLQFAQAHYDEAYFHEKKAVEIAQELHIPERKVYLRYLKIIHSRRNRSFNM